jgi:hypothetical protein
MMQRRDLCSAPETGHHGSVMTDPSSLVAQFGEDATEARIIGWPCPLRFEVMAAPHKPTRLPIGSAAVYVFAFSAAAGQSVPCGAGTVLKVGKAGPNSEARFRYMHYNVSSSNSNLAKSLLAHPVLWPWLGIHNLTSESVGHWIRSNLDRTNFFVPGDRLQVLATLEGYIRARVGSVF